MNKPARCAHTSIRRADTVVGAFDGAVNCNGWPARVRADLGGENADVKSRMLQV